MYEGLKPGENYAQKQWDEVRRKKCSVSVDEFFSDDNLRDFYSQEDAPEKFGYSKSEIHNRAKLKLCKKKFLSAENYKPAVIAPKEKINNLHSRLKVVSNSSCICPQKNLEEMIEMTRRLRKNGKL